VTNEAFRAELAGVPLLLDAASVRQKSRDFFWYSPILKAQMNHLSADLVACPRNEAELVQVVGACARHQVPLTPRGGGTGNYGQAMPLQRGLLLDLTGLTGIEWARGGVVRVAAGSKLIDIDAALQPSGWEQRMHPSTKRTATIGGFVAGGSGGVGSVTWGGLLDAGNVLAARVVTMAAEPQIIELRGIETQKIIHAYGTTGIVTAVEMALAPAWPWIDLVVAFDDLATALDTGLAVAHADGVVKKLLTPVAWPLHKCFKGLQQACPDNSCVLLAMIAEPSVAVFREMVQARGGVVTHAEPSQEGTGHTPIYEYSWNHTTLQALKLDRTITYLQAMYQADSVRDDVARLAALFGDELEQHLEIIRFNGRVTASGLPVVHFSTAERLDEIIAIYRANGVSIANPHAYTLEDGSSHKRASADQLGFKHLTDPQGLLNPGKMRSFRPAA
jgi:FAD/FMN-containing dehydrogenase